MIKNNAKTLGAEQAPILYFSTVLSGAQTKRAPLCFHFLYRQHISTAPHPYGIRMGIFATAGLRFALQAWRLCVNDLRSYGRLT
ncbi:MAG: hypothetical protein KDE31_30255, partial [Caldilineaceae bacterium]|nr:hypothetical protein [Caldilineaceae bacterium]